MLDLGVEPAGLLPSIEAENPQGIRLREDREVYRHPELVAVAQGLGQEWSHGMIVADGTVHNEPRGEELSDCLPNHVRPRYANDLPLVVVR